ncbi:Modification methylase DpnIIB [Anaerohalosphaera lusitana]|uniref:Methyltransferase n=1 Tax=Anaerohalosphaera lusitana TaxID=1936003 RepID=A0A1U9NQ62_9BACT|nr:DNA methyltransferase [Anaerohalosphaera lusitana]AQT70073.1 Modification methylase DpnIIB [Anaerohalosphaera lusitana]
MESRKKNTGKKRNVERNLVSRINTLHSECENTYRRAVETAIEIGQLLTQKKLELEHGEWGKWVESNLAFTCRTASNYMRLYENQNKPELQKCKGVFEALSYLKEETNKNRTKTRQATKEYRRAYADMDLDYDNPPAGQYENKVIAGHNCQVMQEMLNHGMMAKYSAVLGSPPYNVGMFYSSEYDDEKAFDTYMNAIAEPFKYYPDLLRQGGRVIYIVPTFLENKHRDISGDYNYDFPYELRKRVEKVAPSLRFFGHIIWDKGDKAKNPINKKYGSFCSPERPSMRVGHEQIMIWSNEQFTLSSPEGIKPDITEETFLELSWTIWNIAPLVYKNNPHPCSYSSKLAESLIQFLTFPSDWILEPYNGSGVGCKAAQLLGRKFTGVDLNKNYCVYAKALLDAEKYTVSKARMKTILKGHKSLWKHLK